MFMENQRMNELIEIIVCRFDHRLGRLRVSSKYVIIYG